MRVPQALLRWCSDYLITRAMRTPYFHIGENGDYMERYWLVPYMSMGNGEAGMGCGPVSFWRRPIAWILQRFDIAVRIHHIKRSDRADAFHDHPWNYASVILRGNYFESTPVYQNGVYDRTDCQLYEAGEVLIRRAYSKHRLILIGNTAWTLFITFRKRQSWGFFPEPYDHKIPWREFVAEHPERQ